MLKLPKKQEEYQLTLEKTPGDTEGQVMAVPDKTPRRPV